MDHSNTAAVVSAPIPDETPNKERGILFWSLILFNFAVVVVLLKWAELFFIPLTVGILLSYTLGPVVDFFVTWRMPRWLAANIAVLAFVALNSAIGYAVWWQAINLAESLPQTVERIGTELRNTQNDETSALSKLNKAADAVNQVIADDLNKASERAANPSSAVVAVPSNAGQAASVPAAPAKAPAAATAAQATVQPVAPQVKEGSSGVFSGILLNRLLNTFSDLGTVASVLLLAYFLLAAGDQFRRKTVSIIGDTLKQKRITVEVLNEIHRSVQKYLGSMFLTNLILGLMTYVVLFLFGFENARVWGLLAGILHIIPYLGTLLTAAGVFVTGLQQWSDLSMASMAAGTVFLVASVIGTFAQTWILGKIVNINHTAQFVALLFFGWLWGAVGLLIAMPLLVVIKVIVSRIDGLDAVAHFLKD